MRQLGDSKSSNSLVKGKTVSNLFGQTGDEGHSVMSPVVTLKRVLRFIELQDFNLTIIMMSNW